MHGAPQRSPKFHDTGLRVGGVRAAPALLLTVALVLFSVFGLPGTASATPLIDSSPSPVEVGSVQIGQWSTPVSVTLQNVSPDHDAWIEGFGVDSALTARVDHSACGVLEELDSCTVAVQVRADTLGAAQGRVHFQFAFGSPGGVVLRESERVTFRWVGVIPVVNQFPSGGITLSLTDGRGYGALVWAFDPDDGLPTKMRMNIPGYLTRETYWNYYWADMPAYTGVGRHEAMVFLAQLPPGTHDICFDALDNQSGHWHRIGCRTHTVK